MDTLERQRNYYRALAFAFAEQLGTRRMVEIIEEYPEIAEFEELETKGRADLNMIAQLSGVKTAETLYDLAIDPPDHDGPTAGISPFWKQDFDNLLFERLKEVFLLPYMEWEKSDSVRDKTNWIKQLPDFLDS